MDVVANDLFDVRRQRWVGTHEVVERLTRAMLFVFKVFEEMMGRNMSGFAEVVVAFYLGGERRERSQQFLRIICSLVQPLFSPPPLPPSLQVLLLLYEPSSSVF
jgi:hypothetical protein